MVVGQAFASAAGTGIDIGGQAGDSQARLSMHGSLEQDQQIEVDGLPVGNAAWGSWSLVHLADGNYAEYDFSYAANAPEVQTGGVRLNMIPREGGNVFTGRFFASGSTQGLQADNVDQGLIDRGLPERSQNRLSELWSVNPSFGGPVLRDRLWFHLSHSTTVTDQFVAGKFADLEPNDLNHAPATDDPALQTIDAQRLQSSSARLTWQASPRNKFSAYWDNTRIVRPNMSVATSPVWVEESAIDGDTPTNTYLATWTSPLTTRLLLEAGFSHVPTSNRWNSDERVERTLPSALLIDRGVFIRGIGVLPQGGEGAHTRILNSYRNAYRASLSYVTGSHALKVGFRAEQARSINRTADNPSQFLATWSDTLRPFFPGIAFFQANSTAVTTDATPNLGIYVQDQWTRNRLTVKRACGSIISAPATPTRRSPSPATVRSRSTSRERRRSASAICSRGSGWRTTSSEMGGPPSRSPRTGTPNSSVLRS